MSHSSAAVRFSDGTILHGEFNGTVDVLFPFLYKTEEERNNNWRPKKWKYCNNKKHKREEVEIAVTYGGGWYWKGIACKKCMIVISPLSLECMGEEKDFPFPENGLPDWYPDRELYQLNKEIK